MSVEKKIKKCQRVFLWGKGFQGDGMPLVAWTDICKPKKFGGLGINWIRDMNKTLLSKWLWRFGQELVSLWWQVIANKYDLANEWESKMPVLPYDCGCWRAIMNGLEDLKKPQRLM